MPIPASKSSVGIGGRRSLKPSAKQRRRPSRWPIAFICSRTCARRSNGCWNAGPAQFGILSKQFRRRSHRRPRHLSTKPVSPPAPNLSRRLVASNYGKKSNTSVKNGSIVCASSRDEGHSGRRIAALVGLDRQTIRRYLTVSQCPERVGQRSVSPRISHHRVEIDTRLKAGTVNAAAIYRELCDDGCQVSYYAVRRFVRRRRIALGITARRFGLPPRVETPTARQLSFAWLRRAENRDADEQSHIQALQSIEDIREPLTLAGQFVAMVRKQSSQSLAEWLSRTEACSCPELRGFATGLRRDEAAVSAAITEPWSNGQVEGQVNRLKAIKRQMFGRAGFQLLRARVRHAA